MNTYTQIKSLEETLSLQLNGDNSVAFEKALKEAIKSLSKLKKFY